MSPTFFLRPYTPADETSWLRCRVLSFLGSSYFDDVKRRKTAFDNPAIEWVAIDSAAPETVLGLIDVELFGALATIDSIAVHPDHERRGIAGALLEAALAQLPPAVLQLDAWTREDRAANNWYRRNGFELDFEYLHVYRSDQDPSEGFQVPEGLSLQSAFLHAPLDQEQNFRPHFRRVHRCRRYLRRSL